MKLNLGNQIRINRRRMNLTQEQLAEKFGTSPQAISRWEIGATYPDKKVLSVLKSDDKRRFNCKQIANTWLFSLRTTAKPPDYMSFELNLSLAWQKRCEVRIIL